MLPVVPLAVIEVKEGGSVAVSVIERATAASFFEPASHCRLAAVMANNSAFVLPSVKRLLAVIAWVGRFSHAGVVVFHLRHTPAAVLKAYFVVVLAGSVDTIARPVMADICEQSIWLAVVVNIRAVFAI